MSVKGLFDLGKAVAPKIAAGGLFGLGATASDDAEAGVSGLIRNVPEAIAAINKAVNGGAGQRNPIGVMESVMHNPKFANYDEMGTHALKIDGDTAGPYWKQEVTSMGNQLREAGGLSEQADKHLQAWLDDHLGRELGWKPPSADPTKPVRRAPKPEMPPNNAMALALAAAAGKANSAEGYIDLSPGTASALGPNLEGSTAEANGFPAFPVYEEPISRRHQDVVFGGPLGSLGGTFTGGAKEYGHVMDGTLQSGQSLFRLIYGLMTGEGWDGAKSSATDVVNQGVEATSEQFGQYVEDKTGDEVLGFYGKHLGSLLSPL